MHPEAEADEQAAEQVSGAGCLLLDRLAQANEALGQVARDRGRTVVLLCNQKDISLEAMLMSYTALDL